MKKLVSLLTAGTMLLSMATPAMASYDAAKVADIPKVPSDAIQIDGQMDDAVWADAVKVEINQFNTGIKNDTRGTAYMLWGDGALYVYYDVKDADVVTPSEDMQYFQPWNTDSVEMFLDFGNEHADLVQQFRIDCTGFLSYYSEGGADCVYGPDAKQYFGDYAVTKDGEGYNIEAIINLEKWGLKEGDAIGLQLQINDMTAADPNGATAVWNMAQSLGAASWDADLYDYIVLGGALEDSDEPGVPDAPTPDVPVTGTKRIAYYDFNTQGNISIDSIKEVTWDNATVIPVNYVDGTPVEVGTDGTANVYMMTVNGLLFVFAEVYDTEIVEPTEEAHLELPWETDSLELFIDPNGDGAGNIYQFRIDSSGYPSFYMNPDGNITAYGPDAAKPYFAAYKARIGKGCYFLEYCIDLRDFGVSANTQIGINLQLNDRDTNENNEIYQRNSFNGIAGSFEAYAYDTYVIGAGESYKAIGEPIPQNGYCGEHCFWTLDSDGQLTISGYGEIWDAAFSKNPHITSVVINKGITSVNNYAFYGCNNLTSLTLANSVKVIDNSAFRACQSLREIVIPNSVEEIGVWAFEGCSAVEKMVLGKNITYIGESAFHNMKSLKSVTFTGNAPKLVSAVFENTDPDMKLYFYEGTSGWTTPTWTAPDGTVYNTVMLDNETPDVPGEVEIVDSGVCGENLTWTLDAEGLLTISGTGEMWGYYDMQPSDQWNKAAVKKMVIEDGVTTVGHNIVYQSAQLTSLSLPDSIVRIESWAIGWCDQLTSVTLPKNLEHIGSWAFSGTPISEIEIPASVTYIGESAFSQNRKLTAIHVHPDNQNFKTIDNVLFSKDGKTLHAYPNGIDIQRYVVPDTVEKIENRAFYGSRLFNIQLNENLISIGYGAFESSNLLEIRIPASVTEIVGNPIQGCGNLQRIFVDEQNTAYVSKDGVLFTKDGKTLCAFPSGKGGSYAIPNGTEQITAYAIDFARNITSLTVPEGITALTDNINSCHSLETLVLPATLESIDAWSIRNNSKLQSVIFKGNAPAEEEVYGSVETLTRNHPDLTLYYYEGAEGFTTPTWTYYGNEFNTFMISKDGHDPFTHKTEIRDYKAPTAEADGYTGDTWCIDCNVKLEDGTVIPVVRGELDNLTWFMAEGVLTISGNGPIRDFNWDEVKPWNEEEVTRLVIEDGVTRIGMNAFRECRNLTSVALADTITYIGSYAFGSCYQLKTFKIPRDLTTFYGSSMGLTGLQAYECHEDNPMFCAVDGVLYSRDMKTLIRYPGNGPQFPVIPDTVTTIGNSAFIYSNIHGVTIPDSVIEIGYEAFWNNNNLKSITIPKNVAQIGDRAFAACYGLYAINVDPENQYYASKDGVLFDKSMTKLIAYPAQQITPVANYTIPDGVTHISNYAFYGSYIESVTLPESLVSIGIEVFGFCHELTEVTIPKNVTAIGDYAFNWCEKLTSATFEGDVPAEWWYIFNGVSSDFTITCYEGTSNWSTPTWTAPDGTVYKTVMLPRKSPSLLGDINLDGSVDIRDAEALFLYSMLPELYPIAYTGKIDFTNDGSIDIRDAQKLFQYSLLPDLYPLQ